MPTLQQLDTYARVSLERTRHRIHARGGDATIPEMDVMRQAYMQLHRDTPTLCARRRKDI